LLKEQLLTRISNRLQLFKNELSHQPLNLNNIRLLAFDGIPEPYRGVYWRILLNLLPSDRSKWESTLTHYRQSYKEFKRDLIVNPHKNATLFTSTWTQPRDVTNFDHVRFLLPSIQHLSSLSINMITVCVCVCVGL
jgi:hypothetical protein